MSRVFECEGCAERRTSWERRKSIYVFCQTCNKSTWWRWVEQVFYAVR